MSKDVLRYMLAFAEILRVLEKYGAPLVKRIMDELQNNDDPTLDDVTGMVDRIMKDPETYFE